MSDPLSKNYVISSVLLGAGWSPGDICLALGISDSELSEWEERLYFRIAVENWRAFFLALENDAPPDPAYLAKLLAAAGVKSVQVDYPDGTVVSGEILNSDTGDYIQAKEIPDDERVETGDIWSVKHFGRS